MGKPNPELEAFATGIGVGLAAMPGIHVAIFGNAEDWDEEAEHDEGREVGPLTLMTHSDRTKRQVSLEFHEDTRTVKIATIGENMQCREESCDFRNKARLTEALKFLSPGVADRLTTPSAPAPPSMPRSSS